MSQFYIILYKKLQLKYNELFSDVTRVYQTNLLINKTFWKLCNNLSENYKINKYNINYSGL